MEMLDNIHMMVIQPTSRVVFLEASPDERKLRQRLYMQTTYRKVDIPHAMPPINVVDASLMLPAYSSLYDMASEAIERTEGREIARVTGCKKGFDVAARWRGLSSGGYTNLVGCSGCCGIAGRPRPGRPGARV